MSNKKLIMKLINSIISLSLAILLTIVIALAWFTENKSSTSKIGVNVIGAEDDSVTLEGYNYSTSKWTSVNNISFDNFSPGDKYYLRLKVNSVSSSDRILTASYGDFDSYLSSFVNVDILSNPTSEILGYITYLGIPIMDIVASDDSSYPYAVYMDNVKIYSITNDLDVVINEEYKIHNALVSYNLGSSKDDLNPTYFDFSDLDSIEITDSIFDSGVYIYGNSTTYCYFALEYTDYDSTDDDSLYDSNNYFSYQTFSISKISVYIN